MRHPRLRWLAGAGAVALAAALAPNAQASSSAERVDGASAAQLDDRPDAQEEARRAAIEQATSMVISGQAAPVDKGKGKSVQISPGQWAQYGLQSTDSILTFLVDFGTQIDSRFPTAPAGPVHNSIPQPNRSVDNTTYWVPDFTWSDGTIARNRIQTFDSTFGVEASDPISLHRETAAGMTILTVPSQAPVAVFDDSDPLRYYDTANPMGSVKVAGVGVTIKVVQSNSTGKMTVKVN